LDDLGPNSVPSLAQNYSLTSGRTLQAIAFAGLSLSFFQASGFLSLGTSNQAFSLSLWVQPTTLAGTLVQISTGTLGTGTCRSFIGFASNGSLVAQVLTSSNYVDVLYSSLQPMSFSHVVQTWSSTSGLRLYVNSALVGSIAASTYLGTSTWVNYLAVGDCLSGCVSCFAGVGNQIASGPFAGAVDDFRVYSRELTANDVCNLFVHS
jgi:hypothetical protein